ncbi:MAG TPA: ABC transporter ATP-binding protein [Mycobacteriales bacterium]|nr:ABC transporter ATP-binding protein [Mycobacteriales bacterium]
MTALLEVEGLRAGYGSLPALHGVSFAVEKGTTAAVFGLNGAGKTTTVNTIAGVLETWAGEVRIDGERISGLPADEVVRHGVSLSPEGRRVFAELSVRTNLELGAWTRRNELAHNLDRVFSYFPRLKERSGQLAGTMSGGEQQMLAIGRALMASPRLLLIDEASLGLSPLLAETVFKIVAEISKDGTTVVIVEQNIGVLPYADQAVLLEKGVVTYDGKASELMKTNDLRATYLG